MNKDALRAPLSLNEALIEKHRIKGEADPALDALASALRYGRESCERIVKKAEVIRSNPMLTLLANERALKNYVEVEVDRITAKLKAARQRALGEIEAEERAMLPREPKDAASLVASSDIRQALRTMPDAKRAEIVATADDSIVGAFASGPSWLSGLSDAQLGVAVTSWQRRRFPEQLARLASLRESVKAFDTADGALAAWVYGTPSTKPVLDWDGIERAEAAERDARAASAA